MGHRGSTPFTHYINIDLNVSNTANILIIIAIGTLNGIIRTTILNLHIQQYDILATHIDIAILL